MDVVNKERRHELAQSFQVTFDAANPDALARFWALALDYVEQSPPPGYTDWPSFFAANNIIVEEGAASAIVDPTGHGPRLYFQRVPEPKTAKNRVHLDLNVSDARTFGVEEGRRRVEERVNELTAFGAALVQRFDERGEFWVVMHDPEGNEFCVH